MKTAKIFTTGRSQAVRLPKEFRLKGKEVYVTKNGNSILLTPKSDFDWDNWFDALDNLKIDIERDQKEQSREGLDDVFA
jgi:antitoxin VapB